MTPALLDELRETVRRQPTRLGHLYAQSREAGSVWSIEQLRLLLETFDGFEMRGGAGATDPEIALGGQTPEETLLAAVRQVLAHESGRPVPMAKVIGLLPAGQTTSLEQLRALAANVADLEVRGAMIRRTQGN